MRTIKTYFKEEPFYNALNQELRISRVRSCASVVSQAPGRTRRCLWRRSNNGLSMIFDLYSGFGCAARASR